MKKIGLTLLAGASLLLFAACGNSSEKAESAADKEEVIVGLDDTFVRWAFKMTKGTSLVSMLT